MTTLIAPRIAPRISPAVQRRSLWAAAHPRLWCFSCQRYGGWHQDGDGAIVCRACTRCLIAAEAGAD